MGRPRTTKATTDVSLPNRTDSDPEYRFDPSAIYETRGEWEDAREKLEAMLDTVKASGEEPFQTTAELRSLLERVEECHRRKQRLHLAVNLTNAVDCVGAPAWDDYHDLESRFEASLAAVFRRFRDTDSTQLDALVDDLDRYEQYATALRKRAEHVRSIAVEETVEAFAATRRAPTDLLHAVREDLEPTPVERPDGETVAITGGNFRNELAHPNREYRRRVHDTLWSEYESFETTITRAFAAKLRAANAEAAVRGYDSIRDRDLHQPCVPDTGVRSALPETVHDTMVESVRANLDPYHRVLERRRENLSVDELRPWDLDAPLSERDPPDVTYEQAQSLVLNALAPLGEDYVAEVRSVFDDRRVDVYPAESKTGKWYTEYSATDGPFVVANFRNDLRSTFILCHELGHAMHVHHHREGPVRDATSPLAVSEIPSTIHELLLADHLIEEGGALGDAARKRVIVHVGRSFYRSTMFAAFVHAIAQRIERGESLSPETARGTQRDLLREFRAPVTHDEDAGRTWLGRGMRDPYHHYTYVLGAVGAFAVRDRLRNGDLTTEAYREWLRSTGQHSAVELFDRFDCDLDTASPYECAATAFGRYLDESDDR